MDRRFADVRDQALSLPIEQRSELVRDLLLSLEEDANFDPDAEAAWMEVAIQRAEAYDRGETTALDMDESLKRIRESLDERRRKRR
ncbi:MAG: addiction module protein [Planctomycetia bacterium]|nr:addiction module protein [Planctomycetia bacterium]